MSAESVRAILAGHKTQTRRVMKPQPASAPDAAIVCWEPQNNISINMAHISDLALEYCPYGVVGDRLWVREEWRVDAWREERDLISVDYKADGACPREWRQVDDEDLFERLRHQSFDDAKEAFNEQDIYIWEPGDSPCRWRRALYMPRAFSRIDLELTDVRVQRVQEISEEDAIAEGVEPMHVDDFGQTWETHKRGYGVLWNKINGQRIITQESDMGTITGLSCSWDSNPWVWVLTFREVTDAIRDGE